MSYTVKMAVKNLKSAVAKRNWNEVEEILNKFERDLNDILLIEWSIEDIITRAKDLNENDPDYKVPNSDQARDILNTLDHYHDCNYGITWDHLDDATSTYMKSI